MRRDLQLLYPSTPHSTPSYYCPSCEVTAVRHVSSVTGCLPFSTAVADTQITRVISDATYVQFETRNLTL